MGCSKRRAAARSSMEYRSERAPCASSGLSISSSARIWVRIADLVWRLWRRFLEACRSRFRALIEFGT